MKIAKKANPALWEKIKKEVILGNKGGRPGEWSARKAQLAVALYKREGGTFIGKTGRDNALKKWTREQWGYVGELKHSRYLPKKAREALSPAEKGSTSRAKNKGTKEGKQFVRQPRRIARKTARYR